MMSSNLSLLLLITFCFVVPSIRGICGQEELASKRYKFLYFLSTVGGSHYLALSMSGKELVKQGHKVVSLVSSSNTQQLQTADTDLFSVVVFNSSYTQEKRAAVMESLGKTFVSGAMRGFWGKLVYGIKSKFRGEQSAGSMWLRECDDLLGDSATMRRLREEQFDMMVAEGYQFCSLLLAQALNIPFVYKSMLHVVPSDHGVWAGLPIEPSYIPARLLGLTDRMTFLQRVQNVLAHVYYRLWLFLAFDFKGFDQLKVKHNIRPEISTYESNNHASFYLFHGSFALEFPRPMQPNTAYVLFKAGSATHTTIEYDVANFLDTAPNGVVLFSLGTHVSRMERQMTQVIADGFALLPQRVLWQSAAGLPTGVKLANNTKIVRWLPFSKIMEHANVKVLVSHGGSFSMYEAMWVGLPMVGLPLFEDQEDNFDRLEDRGVGLALDITTLTPELLSQTIQKVISDQKFRDNARRISMIMQDMQAMSPPVKTVAHWILHVTKFGGDHLRPAVLDLNYIQRNLLDVYLFILTILALVLGVNFYLCFCCCKRMCVKAGRSHLKKE